MNCGNRGRRHGVHNGQHEIFHCLDNDIKFCTLAETGLKSGGKPFAVCSANCPSFVERIVPEFWKVDVVITSHNYGHFLPEALDSIGLQAKSILGQVVVVDDASDQDDQTKSICEARGVRYLRTEFKSPHLARGAGFALCKSPLVVFLDADNRMREGYLIEAVKLFEGNPRLAIVYPDLAYFGGKSGVLEQPDKHDTARFENLNTIDTGSVWLSQALQQVQPFSKDPVGFEDWRLARNVLRSGRYEAAKNPIPLDYRQHGENRLPAVTRQGYYSFAGLADECVTIFTTFSKRIQKNPELWERRKAWLREQTWPQIRLVVSNTSHELMPSGWMDGLPVLKGISVYDHPVGESGLEDQYRAVVAVEQDVQTAVAAIYNRMWQETRDEFVFVLEDDVFPNKLDAIEALMQCFDVSVCAVSGAYQQRYHPYAWTAWTNTPPNGRPQLVPGLGKGIQRVTGTGFGCVLLRRSQMAAEAITGNTSISRYYDTDLFERLNRKGLQVRINWDVVADHAGEKFPPPTKTAPEKAEEWTPKQPSRGLGDVVAKVTSAIGIKPCGGCKGRQKKLNQLVPFKSS